MGALMASGTCIMSMEPLFELVTEYGTLQKHVNQLETAKVLGIDTETAWTGHFGTALPVG